MSQLKYILKRFEELTPFELHDALALRQKAFIVEQDCPYLDADEKDAKAYHLLGYQNKKLVAYTRVTFPGVMFPEVSIGRIVTDPGKRGMGYGKQITKMALTKVKEIYGEVPVRIAAQSYLQRFYESFGFSGDSDEYLWDGIMHTDMIRIPSKK